MSYAIGGDFNRVDTSQEFQLGQVMQDGNGKIYKYITYSEEAAAVDGVLDEVCYYVSATGYSTNDVTSDLSASNSLGAGVLQATLSDNEFGWVQIKGFAIVALALTAGSDGDPLTPAGSADGTLDVSAAATDHVCAYAGDISAREIMCDFPY